MYAADEKQGPCIPVQKRKQYGISIAAHQHILLELVTLVQEHIQKQHGGLLVQPCP